VSIKKKVARPKQYACFTPEQQKAYERLGTRQRKYVDYRGLGHSKTNAYKLAGFDTKNPTQSSYLMERRNVIMPELIDCLLSQKKVRDLSIQDSNINKQIDALATQEGAERIAQVIEGADSETARRIQFYRDIMNGKIETVRKTSRYNALGEKIETKIEKVSDVETKMKARKELDKILGLNQMPEFDKLQMGDITINIVDASKKEELQDSRNNIVLDPKDVEIIDGEPVFVEEEKVIKEAAKQEQVTTTVVE
jgi:hypothetical protein